MIFFPAEEVKKVNIQFIFNKNCVK